MTDIEIPFEQDRHFRYRFFEALPGLTTWFILCLPFLLSLINVTLAAFFILGYLLMWFVRSVGIDIRALQGFHTMNQHMKFDWQNMLKELESGEVDPNADRPKWHFANVTRVREHPTKFKPSELLHVAMVATYNESREVLEPTLESIIHSDYDMKQVILVIAYEERGGPEVEVNTLALIDKYGHYFKHAMAVKHPKDIPGEMIGKGGNITYAGRKLQKYLEAEKIGPLRVIVTTLDADNHPHKNYFGALSYTYVLSPDPLHNSYQPIPMYTNNIWDAPAPMRVLATGNSFWNVVLSLRPHMLRNFSSHAQSMQSLIDTDFWSVRTIVEDGHQFWRTYFRYDGKHEVYPIYVPIYQDVVFAKGYARTLKAQFIQLRRWTWGASDIAYFVDKGYFHKNNVPKKDLAFKFFRLYEGHITWATAPLLLAFSAFIPVLLNPQNYAANVLPIIVSRVQTIALIGVIATLFVSIKTLPPRPARYKRRRNLWMVLQWVYLPVVTVVYPSFAAIYSQTRLMFGWYIGKFDVTEKAVVSSDNKTTV